jgi:TonB family protein
LTRTDRLRLAAAFAASALLHLSLLTQFPAPQPAKAPPAPFTIGIKADEPRERQAAAPERAAEPSPGAKARPLGRGRREGPPKDAAVDSRRPLVSASPVSAPYRQPQSALPDAARYLGEGQLSALPRIPGELRAIYPRPALAERRRGAVVVQLMIDADGSVAEAIAVPGAQPDLAAAAVEALRYTRFVPARAGMLPVRARVYFEVSFVIE